jgi:hypothetical protein
MHDLLFDRSKFNFRFEKIKLMKLIFKILKKTNRKPLAIMMNSIGRKLLCIEDTTEYNCVEGLLGAKETIYT